MRDRSALKCAAEYLGAIPAGDAHLWKRLADSECERAADEAGAENGDVSIGRVIHGVAPRSVAAASRRLMASMALAANLLWSLANRDRRREP